MFQSTHPGRGATFCAVVVDAEKVFQSTHPGRGATAAFIRAHGEFEFQSTHPGRGATPCGQWGSNVTYVSIHAPRAGCDGLYKGRV